MPSAEPVVCRVFKLPPDTEIFFTLKTLLSEISQKLDHLNLVIVGYSETHPFPEVVQCLNNTRATATAAADTVHTLTLGLVEVAKVYLRLLNELSPTSAPSRVRPLDFPSITINVELVTEYLQRGYKQMTQLIQDATEAVGKIRSLVESGNSDNILLTQENAGVVNDLIHAAKKSALTFQDGEKYFQELNQHVSEVVDKAKISPPLIRETEMVRERWSDFQSASLNLVTEVSDVHISLEDGPRIYTEETLPPGVTVDVITTSAPAPAHPKPSSASTLIKRIRSFVARLFSCITFHHFD